MLIILFLLSKIKRYLYKIAINYLLFPFSMLFIFDSFVLLIYNEVYFEHTQSYKKDENMTIKEVKKFIFEKDYRGIGFPKQNGYYSKKNQKKKICYCLQLNS